MRIRFYIQINIVRAYIIEALALLCVNKFTSAHL